MIGNFASHIPIEISRSSDDNCFHRISVRKDDGDRLKSVDTRTKFSILALQKNFELIATDKSMIIDLVLQLCILSHGKSVRRTASVNLKITQHSSKRKKQSVKLRILLNECKDCVGAWVLQITGTGVGTLSEDRIYSQSNLCLPHIAKQTFGRRGRIDYFVT